MKAAPSISTETPDEGTCTRTRLGAWPVARASSWYSPGAMPSKRKAPRALPAMRWCCSSPGADAREEKEPESLGVRVSSAKGTGAREARSMAVPSRLAPVPSFSWSSVRAWPRGRVTSALAVAKPGARAEAR